MLFNKNSKYSPLTYSFTFTQNRYSILCILNDKKKLSGIDNILTNITEFPGPYPQPNM